MKRILLFAVMIAMAAVSLAGGEGAPDWADVTLNSRGFLDEGEYVLDLGDEPEDEEEPAPESEGEDAPAESPEEENEDEAN